MNAYVFQAALLCEYCAGKVMTDLDGDSNLDALDREQSDYYPQGPYADGGGESDCPQHCDHCLAFLENPLTRDGKNYVREAITEYNATGCGSNAVLSEWREFYDYLDLPEIAGKD